MRKYILTILAITFALNAQTLLFAKESSKKAGSDTSFERFLPSKNFNVEDFKNLLSDNTSVVFEKIILSPVQTAYNDLTKLPQTANKAQAFKENIAKADAKASYDTAYAQNLMDAYYKVYLNTVKNPNESADFNLTEQELTKIINDYKNKIVNLLQDNYAFKIEKNKNKNLTLSDYLNKVVNNNITLLSQYAKANPNIKLYDCQEEQTEVLIKAHKDWASGFTHQKMLIEAAALRVIEINLRLAKAGITYDLALFDIISIARESIHGTEIHFNNRALTFNIPKEAYLYVPFGILKLVSRDAKFITALQEIQEKKQNPNYDFATKKISSKSARGQDYVPPQPSPYDSPYGAGSIK